MFQVLTTTPLARFIESIYILLSSNLWCLTWRIDQDHTQSKVLALTRQGGSRSSAFSDKRLPEYSELKCSAIRERIFLQWSVSMIHWSNWTLSQKRLHITSRTTSSIFDRTINFPELDEIFPQIQKKQAYRLSSYRQFGPFRALGWLLPWNCAYETCSFPFLWHFQQ